MTSGVFKKCEQVHVRMEPDKISSISQHCKRLGVSVSDRMRELFRRDIVSCDHFDLMFEPDPPRKAYDAKSR